MLRYLIAAVIFSVFCTTATFAYEPPSPIHLNVELQESSGYNQTFTINVVVTTLDNLPLEYQAADAELQVFLPPALNLIQGDLNWKGTVSPGIRYTHSVTVQATAKKPMIYDIGAVVKSSILPRPLTSRTSILLGENAGLDLDKLSLDQIFAEHPWAKDALGIEVTTTVDKMGTSRETYSVVIDRVQSQSDLDIMPLQEARPNKLYQQEWLDCIAPPEHLQFPGLPDTPTIKRKAAPGTRLQTDDHYHYGYVRNSTGYIRGIKVEYSDRDTRERLGEVYTDANGRFDIT